MKLLLIKWFAPHKYDKIMEERWIQKYHKKIETTGTCECDMIQFTLGLPTTPYKFHLTEVKLNLALRKMYLGKDCWK